MLTCAAFRSCNPLIRHASRTLVGSRAASNRPQSMMMPSRGLVGVSAALVSREDVIPKPSIFSRDFALDDRVALVTGAQRGIGLEAALALVEAGARAVYCIDLPPQPSDDWKKVRDYASRMEGKSGQGRLEYISADVTDQEAMWDLGKSIGDKEGRFDVCITAAGIATVEPFVEISAEGHRSVIDVNLNGSFFTAQSAVRQMQRFGNGGSVILVASAVGSIAAKDIPVTPYGASKGAAIQLARGIACEVASHGIRVNSLSPGWIGTNMTAGVRDTDPQYCEKLVPMRRIGETRELRGIVTFLASDASSYCTGSNFTVDGGLKAW